MNREHIERMTKKFSDQGKLIEAGWFSMVLACELEDAPDIQLKEMRMAFFAGAQHLFGSIMSILDPGEEPTDKDLERMDLIQKELDAFIKEFTDENIPTEGSA
jgi:hypothetical protein